jgi:dihydroxy-acid dehydratase
MSGLASPRRLQIAPHPAEWQRRRQELEASGGYPFPASQTPWQEIERHYFGQMGEGMILEGMEKYQRIAQTRGVPRDSH